MPITVIIRRLQTVKPPALLPGQTLILNIITATEAAPDLKADKLLYQEVIRLHHQMKQEVIPLLPVAVAAVLHRAVTIQVLLAAGQNVVGNKSVSIYFW